MPTWARYYPRNTVIPPVIPKKTRLCQQHAKLFWLVEIYDIVYFYERACPGLHLVQRSSLGSLWEGSEVRFKVWPSSPKSVAFFFLLSSGFFCSFFFYWLFCQLSLFLTITSLSRVSLTLALLVPNFVHALTMSLPPLPCLHMYQPMRTYLVLSPFADVLPSFHLVLQDAQARGTRTSVRISLVIVWLGPPQPPPRCLTTTLSLLTSLSLFMCLFCR